MKIERIYGGGTFVVHEGRWENDKERKLAETVDFFEIVLVYENGSVEVRIPVGWVKNPQEMQLYCTRMIETSADMSAKLFVDLNALFKGLGR